MSKTDFDDAYQRYDAVAQEAKKSKSVRWELFRKWLLYPLIVIGLITVLIMQFVTMAKTDGIVAVAVENPEEETVPEVPAVVLQ